MEERIIEITNRDKWNMKLLGYRLLRSRNTIGIVESVCKSDLADVDVYYYTGRGTVTREVFKFSEISESILEGL